MLLDLKSQKSSWKLTRSSFLSFLKGHVSNRPFPSSTGSLYQNEVRCSAFDMEMIFHSHANKTHFHKKGCALSLILKKRVFVTRNWPIEVLPALLDPFLEAVELPGCDSFLTSRSLILPGKILRLERNTAGSAIYSVGSIVCFPVDDRDLLLLVSLKQNTIDFRFNVFMFIW